MHNPGHNYIGTEHILLGLLREGEGVAARVLETLGADPAKIRTQVRTAEQACIPPLADLCLIGFNLYFHLCIHETKTLILLIRPTNTYSLTPTCFLDIPSVQVIRMVGESQEAVGAGAGASGSGPSGQNKMATLMEYGTNLTTQAAEVGVTI